MVTIKDFNYEQFERCCQKYNDRANFVFVFFTTVTIFEVFDWGEIIFCIFYNKI